MTDHDDLASRVAWLEEQLGEIGRTAASERSMQILRDRLTALVQLVEQLGARIRELERLASVDLG